MLLSSMLTGQKGQVVAIHSKGEVSIRLIEMGVIAGALFTLIRKAPLGDPIEILINGFHLTLRKKEADGIQVKQIDN